MAKSPDDIASEIENLRQETDIIVDELMKRASLPSIARGMTATVTDTANSVVNEASAVANNAATTLTHLVD